MYDLTLIGIGTGNPDHLTLQAIKAINAADPVSYTHLDVYKRQTLHDAAHDVRHSTGFPCH